MHMAYNDDERGDFDADMEEMRDEERPSRRNTAAEDDDL